MSKHYFCKTKLYLRKKNTSDIDFVIFKMNNVICTAFLGACLRLAVCQVEQIAVYRNVFNNIKMCATR